MSAEFPTLAEVMAGHQGYQASMAQSTWVCERSCGWRGDVNGGRGQWESHVADAWREACTIRTVEELESLPHESVAVLLGLNGGAIQRRHGTWYWANDDCDDGWSGELDQFLPALLIHHPDWAKS